MALPNVPAMQGVKLANDPMDSLSIAGNNNGRMQPPPFNPFESQAFNQVQTVLNEMPQKDARKLTRPITYGPLMDLNTLKPPTGGSGRLNLVLEGDSLTVGYGPWFQDMMNGEVINVSNDAISGETIQQMQTQVPELSRKYNPDAKDNLMVLWAGTNDLCWEEGGNPIKAFENLENLASQYSKQGFKVMVLTLGYTRPRTMPQANAYNALIKAAKGPWDAVLDVTQIPGIEAHLENDMVHYTPSGYKKIADEVEKSLITLGWTQ